MGDIHVKRVEIATWASLGFALASLLVPTLVFWGKLSRQVGFSPDPLDWATFSSYLAPFAAISASFLSISVVLYASVIVTTQVQAAARRTKQTRTALELSSQYYSRSYYLDVIVPTWEIASKWLSWRGTEGDEYRRQVAGGQFLFTQVSFTDEKSAKTVPYQNEIQFVGHFENRDLCGDRSIGNEHMVLSMWLRFWSEVSLLIDAEEIDRNDAKARFASFYSYSVDFLQQLWLTGWFLSRLTDPNPDSKDFVPENWDEVAERLEKPPVVDAMWVLFYRLENVFFDDPSYLRKSYVENRLCAQIVAESYPEEVLNRKKTAQQRGCESVWRNSVSDDKKTDPPTE